MRPQDHAAIDKPTYPIPDLSQYQQDEACLPADFWEAFDLYFAGIKGTADERRTQTQRYWIAADVVAAHCGFEQLDGWALEADGDVLVLSSTNPFRSHVTVSDPAIVRAGKIALEALGNIERIDQFQHILSGAPVWSFLPSQPGQVADIYQEIEEIDGMLQELQIAAESGADVSDRIAEYEETRRFVRDCRGWPGDELPKGKP